MFKVVNGGIMPTRGSKYSACVDLYANEDCVIGAGETVMVGLGVCIDMIGCEKAIEYECLKDKRCRENFLKSNYLQLMLRSSLAKKGLIIPNGVGVIDLDYEDEIKILIHNPVTPIALGVVLSAFQVGIKGKAMGLAKERILEIAKEQTKEDNKKCTCEIKKGDKIAQITLLEHKSYLFGIDTEDKRDGGFGSTNKKDKE